MSVISLRRITPKIGQSELALERVRAMGGIMASNGARVRVGRGVGGEGAGDLHLYANLENFEALGKLTARMATDPSRAKLLHERELNPAGSIIGPEVYRTVYGEVAPEYPVVMQREYQIARANMAAAVEILPDIEVLSKDHDTKIMAAVPVIADDIGRLIVIYYFKSFEDLGVVIDSVGMSEAFQKIVIRANELGTLTKSRVVAQI